MKMPSTIDEVRDALTTDAFRTMIAPYGVLLNTGLYGSPDGYSCDQRGFAKPTLDVRVLGLAPTSLYEFRLNPVTPLMYCSPSGDVWQPDRHFFTDKGSIPAAFRWKFSPDEAVWFLFHDSCYMYHGLYRMDPITGLFSMVPWERERADSSLHDGYLVQWPDGGYRANAIWAAVRAGGWIPWSKDRSSQETEWRGLCAQNT